MLKTITCWLLFVSFISWVFLPPGLEMYLAGFGGITPDMVSSALLRCTVLLFLFAVLFLD